MSKRQTLVTLHVRWTGKPPRRGTWIVSKGRALRIMETQETRVICARYDRAAVPPGAAVHTWDEFATRPARVPVQRRRRVDHLHSLLRRGAITEREFAAAMRFRDTLERSIPGVPVSGQLLAAPVRGGGLGDLGVDDRHLRARKAVERALVAVGAQHVPVLDWVVLGNGSTNGFAAHVHTHHLKAADQLRNALTLLDQHYNPPVFGRAR